MRAAGISTVQQTLTTEAANVLKLAVADAQRRGHVQVTPLHVAATLLTSGSFLRHACIQSHLHLPNPPQCRALELCFNVALDRLQTSSSSASSSSAGAPPPAPVLNNALVAALKRAQAHQRRGYPEQQQVPLLAVKVEMEQLVVSILDDPSVSRVMREAGFSSTQVKGSLEDAMAAAAAAAAAAGIGIPAAVASTVRLKLGPSLLDATGSASSPSKPSSPATSHRHSHDVARAMQVMLNPGRKRSPLLLGDSNAPHSLAEELLRRLDDQAPPPLRGSKVVKPQLASIALGLHTREEVGRKLGELTRSAEDVASSALVLFLGDLQWLIERPPSSDAAAYCPVQHAIGEIARLVASGGSRVWLLAVASSQTYIRCQARHPGLDALWGLQPLPVAATIGGLGLSLRSNPVNSRIPGLEGRTASHTLDSYASPPPSFRCWPPLTPVKLSSIPSSASEPACCSECTSKFEQELAQGQEKEASLEAGKSKIDSLPLWLKQSTNQERKDSLQRKWVHTCLRLHGSSQNALKPATSIPWLSLQSTGSITDKRISSAAPANRPLEIGLSLASPAPEVATELVLGRNSTSSNNEEEPNKSQKLIFNRTLTHGGLPSLKQQPLSKVTSPMPPPSSDGNLPGIGMFKKLSNGEHPVDSAVRRPVSGILISLDFKALVKALEENVPWQKEAVQAIASEVLQCRSGLRTRRNGSVKTDAWLLLLGPDTMGKRKIARLLAEHVFGSDKHFTKISLRTIGQYVRGRTPLDRIAEAVRTKQFSVLLLEDVDEVDPRLKSALVKAMDSGRLADSTGREVSIVNSIFVMTSGRGDELLLPSMESSKLKLSERSVSGAEIVGMKLKPRKDVERLDKGQVMYKSGRIAVVGRQQDLPRSGDNDAAAVSANCNNVLETRLSPGRSDGENLVTTMTIKRKLDGTVECTKRNRLIAPLDLNIDPEPEMEQEREEVDQVEEDGGASKQLVKEALESLGADFCKGLSATVVLRPFDFDKVGEMVVEEVNKVLAGWKQIHELEMEWEVLNQLVAVLWQGQRDEFLDWVAGVLRTSISKLVEELQHQDKVSIVKLAADKVEPGVSHLPLAIKTEAST